MQRCKDKNIYIRLADVLNNMGLSYNILSNILLEHNAIITGSFILQIINNEFHPQSDIDFCLFGNKIDKIFQKRIKYLYKSAMEKHNINHKSEIYNYYNCVDDNIMHEEKSHYIKKNEDSSVTY